MENQNQSYVQNESVDVEEKRQDQFLHENKDEQPEVNGDPSETISDDDLQSDNKAVGIADTDSLLAEIDDRDGYPDGDDPDDDDPDDDDVEIDDPDDDDLDIEDPDDDDIELDDDILPGDNDLEDDDDDLEDEFLNSTQHS